MEERKVKRFNNSTASGDTFEGSPGRIKILFNKTHTHKNGIH